MAEQTFFCDNLIATPECDHYCVVHLHACPYAILEEAAYGCIDFKPPKQR